MVPRASQYGFSSVHDEQLRAMRLKRSREILRQHAELIEPIVLSVVVDYLTAKGHNCGRFVSVGLVRASAGTEEAFAWACPGNHIQLLLTYQSGAGWGDDLNQIMIRYVGHEWTQIDRLETVIREQLVRIFGLSDTTVSVRSSCSETEPISLERVEEEKG